MLENYDKIIVATYDQNNEILKKLKIKIKNKYKYELVEKIAVKLPLAQSTVDGFNTTKTIEETIRQNLKTLLLTRPGERVMDPQFGIGVDTYLFESFTEATYTSLKQNITQQVATYMPFLSILNIKIESGSDFSPPDFNKLFLSVKYSIDSVSIVDILNINVTNNQ